MTQPTPAEQCCECGSSDVRYHNYREQPFCWPCADGRGPNSPKPEPAERHTVDSITSDALDALYAEREWWHQAFLAARDYEDRRTAERDQFQRERNEQQRRAEQAEAKLAAFRDRVQAITDEARGGTRQELGYALAALDEHQEQQT
ncbi:hypothetical protein Q5762_07350 [Streptomyces sp. P9(2023)]|uniref:hypothetical protein n=1 Tax=Streptomyces sp. P9(2023) TaxID=3064394 RepID=UPI0028F411FE|nr:hypothetical protein [Streptomyces sp. P9(2023)]MDT9688172.1 hypothetical protein [Streptomyces sp. P9(2023)]